MKAVVSITLDEAFVVHDIKVIEGEKGLFIAMPSRKTADGEYRDIAHPINSQTREVIQNTILEAYGKAANLPEEEDITGYASWKLRNNEANEKGRCTQKWSCVQRLSFCYSFFFSVSTMSSRTYFPINFCSSLESSFG